MSCLSTEPVDSSVKKHRFADVLGISMYFRVPSIGLSEAFAIFIFLGIALVFTIAFTSYLSSLYVSNMDTITLQNVVDAEGRNIVVRFLASNSTSVALLLRRLDKGSQIVFFTIVKTVAGEYKVLTCNNYTSTRNTVHMLGRENIGRIYIVSRGEVYTFSQYLRYLGIELNLNDVDICSINVGENNENIVMYVKFDEPVEEMNIYISAIVNNNVYVANSYSFKL